MQTGLTDITNMPLSAKLQDGKFEQPASQHSTMQSVSLNEVNNAGQEENVLGSVDSILEGASELKQNMIKRAYLMKKSITRKLAKKSPKTQMKSSTKYGIHFHGAKELERGITKRSYLVRRSITRRLGKRGEKIQKQAGLGSGIAKVYAKEEIKDLKRKAKRFGRSFGKDSSSAKQSLKEGSQELKGKAKQFQREFKKDADMAGASLRQGASELRMKARKLINDMPRKAGDNKPTDFESAPSKFLIEFSSSEWNGSTGKQRTQSSKDQSFEGSPSKWSTEISAHDWNESSSLLAKQQAGFLMSKAQDFIKRASRQVNWAQKRLGSWAGDFKKGASKLYNETAKKL